MLEPNSEMLPEYDLSQATRGRRHTHKIAIDLPGVQFLTNTQGQKTAVLLDLNRHQHLWETTSSQHPANFQYLIDSHTRSVFLDFDHHQALWQALYDQIITTLPGYDSDYSSNPPA
jgi:hypothetical protein